MFDKRKSLTTGNGAKKRQKLDHEELIPSSFEEDLALIESLEKESQSTNDGSQQDEFRLVHKVQYSHQKMIHNLYDYIII